MTFNKRITATFFSAILLSCMSPEGKAQKSGTETLSSMNRIFVHTDKDEYLAGELIWFKTYLVDASSNKPVDRNNIIYIELLNSKGKPALQGKISALKEKSNGSFYLPADLSTGQYLLVAYTTEMKNAGPQTYFRKKIDVINTLKALPAAAVSGASPVFIGFYPEGGSIIAGQQTKFGFYVMNPSSGKGLDASGVIINQKKDTVVNLKTLAYGMGQVRFTPLPQDKYTAIIKVGDSTFRSDISLPAPAEYQLAVEHADGNRLRVTALYKAANSAAGQSKMRLIMHAAQKTKAGVDLTLSNGTPFEYFVDKSKLGSGVTYFTLFNNADQPVCERLMFIQPAAPLARVNIDLNEKGVGKREEIHIGLQLNQGSTTDTMNGSLAIVPLNVRNTEKTSSIYEYLLLGADVPGNIEAPDFYFTPKAQTDPAYIDNLMLVSGWRKFSGYSPRPRSMSEYHGHLITARIVDTWNNQPKAKVSCTLTTPSYPFGFYTALSDTNGIVRFEVQNYTGPGSITIKALSNMTTNPYKVEVLSPFDDRLATDSFQQTFTASVFDSTTLTQRNLAMQTLNTYRHSELNVFTPPAQADSFAFYGKAEYSYELDKYTRFSTMEEILREYVTPIGVTAKGSGLTMSIYNERDRVFYNEFMLVLLDGVPLSNPNMIFNYDPYKVKKIDIVPRRYLYGANQYFGIASFETFKGQFDATELDPSSVLVDYEGLQLKREFYTPVYTGSEKGDSRIPDLRTTLLWIPDIDLTGNETKKIKGFTSDLTGSYQVIFCGITASGVPVQQVSSFEVK